jgi:hypothetical protein
MPAFLLPMLLKGFGFVKEAIKAAIGFIVRHPWQSTSVLLLVACAWLWRANNGLHDTIRTERARYAETVAGYKNAAAEAAAIQAHNLARVKVAQAEINERVSNDYQARIDAARATADRLRRTSGQISNPAVGMPAASEGPARIAQAAQDGFSLAQRLTAQEQAIQLDELINWVEAQSSVETSPGGTQ